MLLKQFFNQTLVNSYLIHVLAASFLMSSALARPLDLQRDDGSVAANVVYQGDYYLDENGLPVKLYRKKGVYALPFNSSSKAKANLNRILSTSNGSWVRINKHNLTGAQVIRSNNFLNGKKAFRSKGSQPLVTSDKPMIELEPVFTSVNGRGDLLLLNSITLELNVSKNSADSITHLLESHKMRLVRKLALSGHIYSVEPLRYLGVEGQLALVRGLGRDPLVKWAEPQFYMQAKRAQANLMNPPGDPLYFRQWHLNNSGFGGSRCDADCDVPEAWALDNGSGAATGAGIVVAVVDDGVQTNHPDLNVDLINGKDFVDDGVDSTLCGHDGENGPDDDPNPSPDIGCVVSGDILNADNHGTAVAGIIAAKSNSLGGVGVAFNAQILPIRALSDYDIASTVDNSPLCDRLAEAVEYAAQKAHVINLSWTLPINCNALTTAIENATTGSVTIGDGSVRSGGSPVVAASGNDASGWVKVTTQVSAGEHAYEWRYLRSDFPSLDISAIDEAVRVDDITWPDGSVESFETLSTFDGGVFTTAWEVNQCTNSCAGEEGELKPLWSIQTQPEFARSGNKSANLNAGSSATKEHFCGNSYLHTLRDDQAGEVSFWIWVSANTQDGFDKFEFLVDGKEIISYGDIAAFGFVNDNVGYPALLSNAISSTEAGVIAVGASASGDLTGNITALSNAEYKASYSQFGETLDVVAPAGGQFLAITTTDRFLNATNDTLGLNNAGSTNDTSDLRFTQRFSGTSAAAAIVSGVAAAIVATDNTLTAQQVKDLIKDNADEIGNAPFVGGRNDQVGHGRVNMYKALRAARSEAIDEPTVSCEPQSFSYQVSNDLLLPRYRPQVSSGMCPALGPMPESENSCFTLRASNGTVVVFCL